MPRKIESSCSEAKIVRTGKEKTEDFSKLLTRRVGKNNDFSLSPYGRDRRVVTTSDIKGALSRYLATF